MLVSSYNIIIRSCAKHMARITVNFRLSIFVDRQNKENENESKNKQSMEKKKTKRKKIFILLINRSQVCKRIY